MRTSLAAKAVWGSLTPPRVVSLLAAATYVVMIGCAAGVLSGPGTTPPSTLLATVLMIVGAAVAAPSAWRGWWGVEAPACGLVLLGIAGVTSLDVTRSMTTDRWPGWPLWIAVALCLLLTQRVLRIWGNRWEPGREPMTSLRRQVMRVQAARVLAADVIAANQEERGRNDQG